MTVAPDDRDNIFKRRQGVQDGTCPPIPAVPRLKVKNPRFLSGSQMFPQGIHEKSVDGRECPSDVKRAAMCDSGHYRSLYHRRNQYDWPPSEGQALPTTL
jgi:hypothetical protein